MDGVPLLEELKERDDRYRSGGAGFVINEGTMIADGFRVREKPLEGTRSVRPSLSQVVG